MRPCPPSFDGAQAGGSLASPGPALGGRARAGAACLPAESFVRQNSLKRFCVRLTFNYPHGESTTKDLYLDIKHTSIISRPSYSLISVL